MQCMPKQRAEAPLGQIDVPDVCTINVPGVRLLCTPPLRHQWRKPINTKALSMKIAHSIAQVMHWWATVPTAGRRTSFRPHVVQRATGIAPGNLPAILMLMGWRSSRMWSRESGRRVLRVHYSPPGVQPPQARRGRPPGPLLKLFAG